jgi:hypothetical protein
VARHIFQACPVWIFIYFIYLALPTRAGSPQQHMPITVGPFCLTHPVNFPCGRKPEYPGKTHDFRQSVDFYSFHRGLGSSRIEKVLTETWTCGLRANHLATEAPIYTQSNIKQASYSPEYITPTQQISQSVYL